MLGYAELGRIDLYPAGMYGGLVSLIRLSSAHGRCKREGGGECRRDPPAPANGVLYLASNLPD